MKYQYNPWPLGKLKKEHQRPEPDLLKDRGYIWNDARDIVDICEKKIADFWGAKYCVTTDCCSHAIFLSLKYRLHTGFLNPKEEIIIPRHTYVSVPMQIINAGLTVRFADWRWEGYYELCQSGVIDAAVTWQRGFYDPGYLMCLSFQIKKAIPVGKMGAILTDDEEAYRWLKLASYDGRDLTTPYDQPGHVKMIGYHMYATPEDCARAILLMDDLPEDRGFYMGSENYPDVSKMIYEI